MKSYIVKERADGTRYFDENTPAGNINPDVVGDGLKYTGGKLSVDGTDIVHKSGDEGITGTKTFTASPLVLTPNLGDNSTKAANTAWVRQSMGTGLLYNERTKQIETRFFNGQLTFYVRTDGDDNNDGLTEETAFRTVYRAIWESRCWYSAGNEGRMVGIYIDIGEGTFTPDPAIKYFNFHVCNSYRIALRGAGKDKTILTGGEFQLSGINIHVSCESLSLRCFVNIRDGSCLRCYNVDFISASESYSGRLLSLDKCSLANIEGTCVFSGNCGLAIEITRGSCLLLGGSSISFNTNSTSGTLSVRDASVAVVGTGTAFTGTATGKRYIVSENSVIQTFGRGANLIPGSADGVIYTGGVYA